MHPSVLLLLQLRFRQAGRIIKAGGISLWLLLPVVLFFVAATVHDSTLWSVLNMNVVMLILLLLADWQRRDKKFLFLLPARGYRLRFWEYFLVLLLLNSYGLFLSATNLIFLAATQLLLALGLRFIDLPKRRFQPGISRRLTVLLPSNLYDIKSGLRQAFLLFVLVWIAGLFACWYLPAISFIVAFFLTLLLEVLIASEPVIILQSHRTIRMAIFGKIKANLLFFLLFFSPHILISIFRFPDFTGWISVGVSLWMLCATVAYTVLLKYTGSQQPASNLIKGIKVMLFLIVSPLLPLSIYFIYQQYKNVLCKLRPLLA